MKRKNEHDARFPILRQRLIELQGERTHEEFAQDIGVTRQTMGFYLRGERIPDSETLTQICTRCNVSADWLLGLSKVKTPSANVQAICEYTGLSEKAVSLLHDEASGPSNPLDEVNRLFENFGKIHGLICEIATAMKAIRKNKQQGRIVKPLPQDVVASVAKWENEDGGVVLDHIQAADWHSHHAGNMLRDLIVATACVGISPSFTDELAMYNMTFPECSEAQDYGSSEKEE